MKYATGDKIALKSDQREGRIIGYLDAKTAEVILTDGETISISEDELEYPYLNMFRKASREKNKKEIKKYHTEREDFTQERIPKGLLMGFWPKYFSEDFDDLIETIKIYFYNDTTDDIEFYYSYSDDHSSGLEVRKRLKPYEDVYLHSIPFDSLNDHPSFTLRLAPIDEEPIDVALQLRPKTLFDELSMLSDQQLPAYYKKVADSIHEIYVPSVEDGPTLTSEMMMSGPSSSSIVRPATDDFIDLHIHALFPEDCQSIPPSDILSTQIDTFRRFLAEAIRTRQPRITIMHGIGTGVLRTQIHQILDESAFISRYENELHPEYGYGATIAWIR